MQLSSCSGLVTLCVMAAAHGAVASVATGSCSLSDKPITQFTFANSDFLLAEPYRRSSPDREKLEGVCSFFNNRDVCCTSAGANRINEYLTSSFVKGDNATKYSNVRRHFSERLDMLSKGGWITPSALSIALEATKLMGNAFDASVKYGTTCVDPITEFYAATLCELACDPEVGNHMYEDFTQTGKVTDKKSSSQLHTTSRHPVMLIDETSHYYLRASCDSTLGNLDEAHKLFSKAGKVFQQSLDLLVSSTEDRKSSEETQVPSQELVDVIQMMQRNAEATKALVKVIKSDTLFRQRMLSAGMGDMVVLKNAFFPFLYPITAVSDESDFDSQQRFRSYAFEGAKEDLLDARMEQHLNQLDRENQEALDSRLAVLSIKNEIAEDPSLEATISETLSEAQVDDQHSQDTKLLQTKTKKMAFIDRHDSSLSGTFLQVDEVSEGATSSGAPVPPEEAMFGSFALTDKEDKAVEDAEQVIMNDGKAARRSISTFDKTKGVTTAQRLQNRVKLDSEKNSTTVTEEAVDEHEMFERRKQGQLEINHKILEEVNRPDAFKREESHSSVVAGSIQDSNKSVHRAAPSEGTRFEGSVTNSKRSHNSASLTMVKPSSVSHMRFVDPVTQSNVLAAASQATNRTRTVFPAQNYVTFANAESVESRAAELKQQEQKRKSGTLGHIRKLAQSSSVYGFVLAGIFGTIGVVGLLLGWLNLAQTGFATASGFTAGAYGSLGVGEDVTALVLFICAIVTLVSFGILEIRRVRRDDRMKQREAADFVLGGLEDEDGDLRDDEVDDAADEGATERKPLNEQKYMA